MGEIFEGIEKTQLSEERVWAEAGDGHADLRRKRGPEADK
jgi:hypothetical protein